MYTIAVGNMFDGVCLYGTFEDFDAAELGAFENFDGMEWWIVQIQDI